MLNRLLWLIIFVALAAGVGWLIKRTQRPAQITRGNGHNLLYFWGANCAACDTAWNVLVSLTRDFSWLRLVAINAIESPKEAKQWGVMTIPTIILLDETGQIAYRASGSLSPSQLREAITAYQTHAAQRNYQ